MVICLPTKHLGVLMNSFKRVLALKTELEFGSVGLILRRKENRSTERGNSRSKGENQQQTQPTLEVDTGI